MELVKKYKRKPDIIEAVLYTGKNVSAVSELVGQTKTIETLSRGVIVDWIDEESGLMSYVVVDEGFVLCKNSGEDIWVMDIGEFLETFEVYPS